MPLNDFKCPVHGFFESTEPTPACPHESCQEQVKLVFLKAPAVRTRKPRAKKQTKTQAIDALTQHLAAEFGLSDVSNKNGSVMATARAKEAPSQPAARDPLADVMKARLDQLTAAQRGLVAAKPLAEPGKPKPITPTTPAHMAPKMRPGVTIIHPQDMKR